MTCVCLKFTKNQLLKLTLVSGPKGFFASQGLLESKRETSYLVGGERLGEFKLIDGWELRKKDTCLGAWVVELAILQSKKK